jgi:hypothetical protein
MSPAATFIMDFNDKARVGGQPGCQMSSWRAGR